MAKTFDNITDLKIGLLNEIDADTQKTAPVVATRKTNRKKKGFAEQKRGIDPKSPTVYLLPEEKMYLSRLKAFILLETGEKTTDHALVMMALKEYAKQHFKDFKQEL